ncbi:MAG: serine hydrolase [bacterium]|nr:serine hydrolase [bacterium]
MRLNRYLVILLQVMLFASLTLAQNPQQHWQQFAAPEEAGFSSEKIAEAKAYYDSLNAASFLVIYDGKVLVSWGDVERRYMCHSVRKSLLSALYGIYFGDGVINLDKTLAELNIDDKDTLTASEKEARIRDLLKARSGVYHSAAYETAGMKAIRPKRGSHKRDEFWYYNNWDFNALGKIFEQETGADIFVAFKNRIADPLRMEDFRLMDGYHHLEPENSIYPAYPFRLSARDMARFGLLFLREGVWNGEQIISKEWIKESTTSYSTTDNRGGGYGYLWWVSGELKDLGMYSALGVGAQIIAVLPGANLVVVQRVDTYIGKQQQPDLRLFKMILAAKVSEPKTNPKFIALQNSPSYYIPRDITFDIKSLDKYVFANYNLLGRPASIQKSSNGLMLNSPAFGTFNLFQISETKFVIEDLGQYLYFEFDPNDKPLRISLHQTMAMADLYSAVMEKGMEAAIQEYHSMKEKSLRIQESELNNLGYQFLGMNKATEAIEIFKLNVEANPESFNVYDSLGEGYMTMGNDSLAIQNYNKSLELNSRNTNAELMIKRMMENK